MKKTILISLLALSSLLLLRCNVPAHSASFCNFTTVDKWVLCGGDTIAVLTSVEYGMKKGKKVKELTFKILDNEKNIDIDRLLRYLTRGRDGWEVEVNFDIE